MVRYNVYGSSGCKACNDANSTFEHLAKTRDNIEYNFYNLDDIENVNRLQQILPDFKNDTSVPVIQKCEPDGKCTITRGFREEDYL